MVGRGAAPPRCRCCRAHVVRGAMWSARPGLLCVPATTPHGELFKRPTPGFPFLLFCLQIPRAVGAVLPHGARALPLHPQLVRNDMTRESLGGGAALFCVSLHFLPLVVPFPIFGHEAPAPRECPTGVPHGSAVRDKSRVLGTQSLDPLEAQFPSTVVAGPTKRSRNVYITRVWQPISRNASCHPLDPTDRGPPSAWQRVQWSLTP